MQLLESERARPQGLLLQTHPLEQLRALHAAVRLPVELHRLKQLALLEKAGHVSEQERVNLWEGVVLGQLNGPVPLVQFHARIHCGLYVIAPQISLKALLGHTRIQEYFSKFGKEGVSVRESGQESLQPRVVL